MNNELKWGIVGTILVIILTVLFISQYSNRNNKSQISNSTVNFTQTTSVTLTLAEIAKHNQPQDYWIIINNQVYGVSDYLTPHPGGVGEIIPYCDQDATQAYSTKGGRGKAHSQTANQELGFIILGQVNSKISLPDVNTQQQNINKLKQLSVNRKGDD